MPKPRKALVLLEETPYYHCVSRCVRPAFLCGVDTHSGKSYEHRRHLAKEALSQAERDTISELIIKWRARLLDISWFMRCLNEPIARNG